LPGIKDLTKKRLKLPCRIGAAEGFSGFHADPSLSTLCGLILEGIDSEEEQGSFPGSNKGIRNRIKNIFRIFIP
jgi:cell division ATPase FtsA